MNNYLLFLLLDGLYYLPILDMFKLSKDNRIRPELGSILDTVSKDTADTAPHVSWIHFKSLFPSPANSLRELQSTIPIFEGFDHVLLKIISNMNKSSSNQ